MRRPGSASLVLLAGVLATAWAAIFVRLADEAPALTIAAYRLLFATAILGAFVVWRLSRRRERLPARGLAWAWMALSGAFLAGHFWSWFASLERTSVGSSVVIVAMQPLLAAILGFVFLHERPTRNEYIGIGLATVGLLVIGGRDLVSGGGELSGDALALLGGLFAAAYRTVGRYLRGTIGTAMYSAVVYGAAAVALWALVLIVRPRTSGFEGDTWTYLVLVAVVPQVIGHTAFNWALGRFRVVTVSIANMGEPVLATLLAIPILSEDPTLGVIIGGPIILTGLAVGLSGGKGAPPAASEAELVPP